MAKQSPTTTPIEIPNRLHISPSIRISDFTCFLVIPISLKFPIEQLYLNDKIKNTINNNYTNTKYEKNYI